MPIAGLTSLGFTDKEDSQFFSEDYKDATMRKEFDGGFVQTRPRFTRPLPRVFSTGWTNTSATNAAFFRTFLASKWGGSVAFDYTNPVTAEVISVRFASMPQLKYVGIGGYHRWDILNVKLEEV